MRIDKRPWIFEGIEYEPHCGCEKGHGWEEDITLVYLCSDEGPTVPEDYDHDDLCYNCDLYPWIEVPK